jgi:hypothetical protein
MVKLNAEQLAKMGHGKVRTYNKGCRCNQCRDATAVYNRNQRHKAQGGPSTKGDAAKIDQLMDLMVELGLAEYSDAW